MKLASTLCALLATTAALVLLAPQATAGEVFYRWVDERGEPVNSDRPPPQGIEYEVISTDSNMVRSVGAEEGAVPLKVKPTPSNDFEAVTTDMMAVEKNPEFCQRARENLETLNSAARIRMRDDQGDLYYIDAEQREEQRKAAKDNIALHCE